MGPRMARRRALVRRVQIRVLIGVLLAASSLYLLHPPRDADAAPPGSLVITSVGCFPSASIDIRVSTLATGSGKSNVLHIEWSDGTTTTPAPAQEIPQDAYASSAQSDMYHVDWISEDPSGTPPFTATATVTLSWVWSNGNSKDVAATTASRACS